MPCITVCNVQISSNRDLQMHHAVVITEKRNKDRDTFYYISGRKNFASYKMKNSVYEGISSSE
jgi:hypothetical protein